MHCASSRRLCLWKFKVEKFYSNVTKQVCERVLCGLTFVSSHFPRSFETKSNTTVDAPSSFPPSPSSLLTPLYLDAHNVYGHHLSVGLNWTIKINFGSWLCCFKICQAEFFASWFFTLASHYQTFSSFSIVKTLPKWRDPVQKGKIAT